MFALILFCLSSFLLFVLFHFFDATQESSSNQINAARNSSQSNSNDYSVNTLKYLPTICFNSSFFKSQNVNKKKQFCKNLKQIFDHLRESMSPYCKYFGLENFQIDQNQRLNEELKETISDKYK